MRFKGFFCRKCSGRVFEDEPYRNGNGVKMAVLTCTMCGKEHECEFQDYEHLKDEITRVVKNKSSKR